MCVHNFGVMVVKHIHRQNTGLITGTLVIVVTVIQQAAIMIHLVASRHEKEVQEEEEEAALILKGANRKCHCWRINCWR